MTNGIEGGMIRSMEMVVRRTAAVAFGAALVLSVGVPGGFSQQNNGQASRPGGDARLLNASWAPDTVSWSNGRIAEVKDPGLNETAARVKVPAGWKFVGAILRPGGCYGPVLPVDGLSYTVLAPDGYTAAGQLPGNAWNWASDGTNPAGRKCAAIGIDTAAGFLLNIAVPNIHPDATSVTLVAPTPAMQRGLDGAKRAAPAMGPMHRLLDQAQVKIEYKLGDQAMEELFFVLLDCQVSEMPAYPAMHRAAVERRACAVHGIHFWHAPKGKLDALLATNSPPAEIDRQWDQHVSQQMQAAFAQIQKASDAQFHAIQQHFAEVTDGMMRRGVAFQESQKTSFDHAMAADRASQQAIDHASHLQVLDSLNRQDFIDPSTGRKIETSNQYTHNWISSDKDAVVLNNDPNFDPNGAVSPVRQSWTELIPLN